jgi:hypothetical protein
MSSSEVESAEDYSTGADRRAGPIIAAIAAVIALAAFVPSHLLAGSDFLAIRAFMFAACILVAVRRRRVLTSGELWIVGNLVVVFNPFYEFHLYERARWIWVDAATAGLLAVVLYRKNAPGGEWNGRVWAFLFGVYAFSLVGEELAADASSNTRELLALPVRLAAATWLASMAAILVASPFVLSWDSVKAATTKLRQWRERRGSS